MLTIDATAYDGCQYECRDAAHYADTLIGLISQASTIGLGLTVRAHPYRHDGDDIAATVTEAPALDE